MAKKMKKVAKKGKKTVNFSFLFYLNYFHLRQVMAKLQHMCLCECDHPPQIKTILLIYYNRNESLVKLSLSGRPESNRVFILPKDVYDRYTTAWWAWRDLNSQEIAPNSS